MRWASVVVAICGNLAAFGGGVSEAQECAVIDSLAMSQEQINMIPALTYGMYFKATAENIVPVVTEDKKLQQVTVCFPSATHPVPDIINTSKYLLEYQTWKIENAAATSAAQAIDQEAQLELKTNPFCSGLLSEVEAKVLAEMDMKVVLIKINRCLIAMRATE